MAFTPEQRAKGLATRLANKAKREKNKKDHPTLVSVKHVSPDDYQKLVNEIGDLKAQLAGEQVKRSEAENSALKMAESQGMLMQREITEVPTGRTKKVRRCNEYKTVGYKDDGREIPKPVWHSIDMPTYFYKIDLPPVGGEAVSINGRKFYHGAVYEFDEDELRSIKDIVFKCWKHDSDIHGSDENFYRKKTQPVINMRASR